MQPRALEGMSAAERRRLPAVHRGAALGLHLVPGVVLADVLDHGQPGVTMAAGTAVVLVWVEGGADRDVDHRLRIAQGVDRAIRHAQEDGRHVGLADMLIVPVVREAGSWERARAWWRWRRWLVQLWFWERRRARA